MDSVFEIIAEPNRRAILSLLVSSQQSVGEIEHQLRMSQPDPAETGLRRRQDHPKSYHRFGFSLDSPRLQHSDTRLYL
ncbi:MAG: hypothetical protein WB762_26505 [Candidatus Sulfotelmatobacter sp.]